MTTKKKKLGALDERIAFLEKQDEMQGYQAQHDAMLKSKAAMEKGVVGSGQMSAKEFAAKRAGKGVASNMSGADMAGLAKTGGEAITGKSVGSNLTGDESGMDEQTGSIDGAASGAMMGAQIGGPWGAVIGGIAGAVQGAASARAAAKAHNRQVEAKKHQALAEIEMRKGQQMSSAIQGMAGRMRIT